jgi:hypothetical protein
MVMNQVPQKKHHIRASTIAEVAIALVIISICFVVTGRVILSTTSSTTRYGSIKEQTHFQSKIMNAFQKDTLLPSTWEGVQTNLIELQEKEVNHEAVFYILKVKDQIIWQQKIYKKE